MILSQKRVITLFIIIVGAVGLISLYSLHDTKDSPITLIPKEREIEESKITPGTEVGIGWSLNDNPVEAVNQAVEMALAGKQNKSPDFAIVFVTSNGKLDEMLPNLRERLGEKTKIYGGTSDSRGVMTNKGFVKAAPKPYEEASAAWKKGLAIMTVSSNYINFGVGSAELSAYPSSQAAAKAAILAAIQSAGKTPGMPPRAVLLTPTQGIEEEVIKGVEEVVGKNTPILGGTAGGPQFGVIGEKKVYAQGVSLAVIYTDLPVGWIFEGGFEVTDPHSGVVTKVDGQAIIEIDQRPALEVYDEWLGGKVKKLYEETGDANDIRTLLNLHPIYRKYTSSFGQDYFIFSHAWPKDKTMKDKTIMTSTKLNVGERIYLSHGTWERLLNRIVELPKKAKVQGGMRVNEKPLLGIGYICAGVMGVIPENEREKMPLLIDYANNDAPFIAPFTWGEQGYLPGVCNKHVNLSTSFLVIGSK